MGKLRMIQTRLKLLFLCGQSFFLSSVAQRQRIIPHEIFTDGSFLSSWLQVTGRAENLFNYHLLA